MTDPLFHPLQLGSLPLSNRILMAPMTRDRAGAGDVPSDIMIEYYRQRASAGLIISEGTQPTPEGKGYWRTPGIYSQEQIEGWSKVADAVHREGGLIAMQLMHCGRVVVPENRGYAADIIAPSAIACTDAVPDRTGTPTATAPPRALHADELPAIAAQFAQAARNARQAGIDAVELHCASGYLVNQFLNPASNQRTDDYGGSPENRLRFPIMILEHLAQAIGADRVGFRISPGNGYNDMDISDPWATFAPFLRAADALSLAFVHVIDMGDACPNTLAKVRENIAAPLIANNQLKADSARALLQAKQAEAVSFGRAWIANPDLPARLAQNAPLAKPDYTLLYSGEERGYIDYPPI